MNWLKRYESNKERKVDQRIGFVACIVVNLVTFFVTTALRSIGNNTVQTFSLILPWLVNIGFILLAFIFRPEIAVGYLAFFAVLIIGSVGLSVLVLTACFAGFFAGISIMRVNDQVGAAIMYMVICGIFLSGIVFGGSAFIKIFGRWCYGD